MIKLLICSLFLLSATNAQYSSDSAPLSDSDGLASNMLEDLVAHAASVANQLLAQLLTNTERTTKTLLGNIEIVITSAQSQLSQSIKDFEKDISSSQCQTSVTLEQLRQQIDADLSKCTQNLKDILNNFQQDANDFKIELEKNIKEITNLPKKCENTQSEVGFGSVFNCYIDNIVDVNKEIAIIFNNAREAVARTYQLGEQAVQEGRICANNVIEAITDNLHKILAACQYINKQ